MINVLKIILLTMLTLANLLMIGVSVRYIASEKDATTRIGFTYIGVVTALNVLFTIGGAVW